MKKRILIFLIDAIILIVSLITIVAINEIFFDDGISYNKVDNIGDNYLEDGPFIFFKDSLVTINYIQKDSASEYFVKQESVTKGTIEKVKCNYYPDSINFEVDLNWTFRQEEPVYAKPDKIFAVSDIEGNFAVFKRLLVNNKIIDNNLNWQFQNGHLVLIGDFVDRGYFVTQCLWLIYKLEREAEQKGGKVHYILGNHEIMNMQGDHNYSRDKYHRISNVLNIKQHNFYDTLSYIGKWLSTKNIAEKIGDIIFTHGGLHPEFADQRISLEKINEIARENYYKPYLSIYPKNIGQKLVLSNEGPYWYRGYFNDKEITEKEIDKILSEYQAKYIAVGHTIQKHIIRKFNGKIIGIDIAHPTDQYKSYFPKRLSEGLLIENGIFFRVNEEGIRTEI